MNEIFTRTSVRQFEDKEVEEEKIELILKAAMQAPTAGNQQSWQFYVVRNKETLEKLSKASRFAGCTANAPMAVVIAYQTDSRLPDYNDIDCAIASENIYLECESLGLGTVMLGIAPLAQRMAKVKEILNLPENEEAFTILPIGYPVNKKEAVSRYNEEKVHYVD